MRPTGTVSSTEVPELPAPRGPLSAGVVEALRDGSTPAPHDDAEPYGLDLQLALYCLYELHYRGFRGVEPEREWDPELLALRRELELAFLSTLRDDIPVGHDVAAELQRLLVEPSDAWGATHHLRRDGQLWQLREYVTHRSLYHLKEADPQAWVIPRLSGAAKACFVTVEHDEYGAGQPERMHSHLFAVMMRALGVDDRYGAHLDVVPAEALAEVNLMSMCGLHRSLRGALLGQFATVELTSSPGSDRLVRAMRRLGCSPEAIDFYAEHVEADAVHEQLVRRGVLGPLLTAEPELATDVVFGVRAAIHLAGRFEALLLERWARNESSLLPRASA
ncbi:Iron-containing redox enzyme [Saccharopolyspora antimicrobica]|uniref:Heme oxygenase-like protein n=1 Tax=Saccharopolyspora antimicrobica TaxID=455193 RepID=A0A1I4RUT6_9PSEU|nr:iron-containing redox enzyme family protein [Saccharopolyspora antimicrobica]RKT89148.1 heme oxygenase-like protein [Saccharopolyspora antimicrobica]SFM55790.1 Iron-containing redox enzyme [Saccharopolyspora antimicrobica]